MKKIDFKKILLASFFYIFVYFWFFGWIIFAILYSILGEEKELIALTITILLLFIIGLINETKDAILKLQNETENLRRKLYNDFEIYKNEELNNLQKEYNTLNNKINSFNNYVNDELASKPYLANSIADFLWSIDNFSSQQLKFKRNPAIKASETVKKIAKEKRVLEKEYRTLKYQIGIYEGLFPDLVKYKEATVNDIELYINDSTEDRAKDYLSLDEWNNLSQIEKYQLSLNRYKKARKSNWQIGREFERFVGYRFELNNYKVTYNGAKQGLEDLGRDLIAIKEDEILVIQCKYWSEEKLIHEKHIFQLYGTTLLKQIEEKSKKVRAIFICTNSLSEKAKEVASILNVQIIENYHFDRNYPCIKCNISKIDGEKIYHLPFDQQYDKIEIDFDKGENYVLTVKEAEENGFRRAKKYIAKK